MEKAVSESSSTSLNQHKIAKRRTQKEKHPQRQNQLAGIKV